MTDVTETPAAAETDAGKPETQATETTTLLGGVVTEQAADGTAEAKAEAGAEGEAEAEGEKSTEEEAKPAAPEKYEFVLPEGFTLAEEEAGEFEAFARENNLTNEKANLALALATKHVQKVQEQQLQQWKDNVEAWGNTIRTDKTLGGDKLNASVAVAQKAVARFGSPELVAYLEETGLGNHPDLFRMCYRIGQHISEGGLITGAGSGEGRRSTAEVLYGNTAA